MTYDKKTNKLTLLLSVALALTIQASSADQEASAQDTAAVSATRKPAQKTPTTFPDDEFADEEEFYDDNPPQGINPTANPFGGAGNTGGAPGTSTAKLPAAGGEEDYESMSDEELRQKLEERLREKSAGNDFNNTDAGGFKKAPPAQNNNSIGNFSSNPKMPNLNINSGLASSEAFQANKGPGCLKLDPDTGYGPDIITNFDFPDADVVEIAKTLGKLTCLNFILDKDVRGRISIVSNSAISVGDAWKAFLSALDTNQLTLVPSGRYLRIVRQNIARDKNLKIYSGAYAPETDGMITRVLPLKYINSEDVRKVFMQILSPTTRMLAYEQTNTLIITDTASTIKKIVDIIALLDVEGYDESLHVMKIRHASAEEIAKLIDQLLPGQSAGIGAPPGVARFGKGFAQRKTKEGGVISQIIADARTNSLIVNANAKGVQQVRELLKKLDTKVKVSAGGSRIHVVYLQYADAEQVATTLNNLAAGSSSGATGKPALPGSMSPSNAVLFEGNVKVAADKPTNSLVVTASPTDFAVIKRVLGKLDIARDQVYVEAIIMELSLDKSFNISSSIVKMPEGVGFVPDPSALQNFLLNPVAGLQGLSLGWGHGNQTNITTPDGKSISVKSISGLITALQNNANSNILATPQILTLDNQEASIEIGESVPVPSVTQVQGVGAAQSFTREKVSLALTIKPQINKISNFVKLDIKQKFQDFNNRSVPRALEGQSYGTIERSSQTTVVVQDQDTVVLGGLMRDKIIESASKVPILGDVPILGWLFRSKSTQSQKTNLLVFITPRVIKNYQTVRTILDRKLEERDEFLETANGGKDPYEKQKIKMVQELKPISELKQNYTVDNLEEDDDSADEEDSLDSERLPPRTSQRNEMPILPGNVPAPLQIEASNKQEETQTGKQ